VLQLRVRLLDANPFGVAQGFGIGLPLRSRPKSASTSTSSGQALGRGRFGPPTEHLQLTISGRNTICTPSGCRVQCPQDSPTEGRSSVHRAIPHKRRRAGWGMLQRFGAAA
jgi:hypothetical protein